MPASPPKRGGWTAIIVAVTLVVGYGAAYLSVVQPVAAPGESAAGIQEFTIEPRYPHDSFGIVFAPAHWLDRVIRAEAWEWQP